MMTTTSEQQRARQQDMYRTACAEEERHRFTCPDIPPASPMIDEFHVMAAPIAQGGGQVLSEEEAWEISQQQLAQQQQLARQKILAAK
jgi:hypothetical protein